MFHPSVFSPRPSALSVSLPDEMRLLVTPEMNHLSFSAETKWMTIERGLLLSSPPPQRLLVRGGTLCKMPPFAEVIRFNESGPSGI